MAKREEIERQAENLILPVLEEHRFELWDTEYVKEAGTWYLRYYIDKEGGITIDDCETVSRRVSDLPDEKDFIPEAYILEVSSPGLGRQLKKPRDFERSLGEEVEIRLFRAVEGSKEYTGVLRGYDEKTFTIEFEDGETMVIARPDVAVIRLAFDF
ncbi:MAG: ribosome maturation factor RimP [Lachnospiraceae bacterium]|nr:ribosome maturation factor RimP [Lachnospiraceae bacterium]